MAERTVPITYMNSTAAIKGFTGAHGGAVCTSSNAERALRWAFEQAGRTARCCSCPTSTSAATPPSCSWASGLDECVVFNPHQPDGGLTPRAAAGDAKMILWRGHCSVHGRFTAANVADVRARIPGVTILVHPECRHEVVLAADLVGSTEYIIRTIDAAPAGSAWAVGTELNLVRRLAERHPDKRIVFLEKNVCYCSTMNRIDLPHLVHSLESLAPRRGRQPDRRRPARWPPTPGWRSTGCSRCPRRHYAGPMSSAVHARRGLREVRPRHR